MYSCSSGSSFAKPASGLRCDAWNAMNPVATMKIATTTRRLRKIRFSSRLIIASLPLFRCKVGQRQLPDTALTRKKQLAAARVGNRLNAGAARLLVHRDGAAVVLRDQNDATEPDDHDRSVLQPDTGIQHRHGSGLHHG